MGRKSIVLDQADCDHIHRTYKYDPETGLITFRTTTGLKAGKVTGTCEQSGYLAMFVSLPGRRRCLKTHLVGWLLYYGVWPDHEVDHWDGHKDHNWIRNLKRATGTQNRANTKKYASYAGKPTSSIYKGVSWTKDVQKWKAYIRKDKKLINLGFYDDEREAALAYDKAAIEHFEDRVRPNFPADVTTPQPSGQGDVRPLSGVE